MIIEDTKERTKVITDEVDDERHLGHDDPSRSFDYLIECEDETIYRVERKRWSDFVSTWKSGELNRQLENVHLLIVEHDDAWTEAFILQSKSEGQQRLHENARKHLASISANMWVVETSSERETVQVMRYIEDRGGELNVRQNTVNYRAQDARQSMLADLPHINVERELEDGVLLGERLEEIVDWEQVVDGLNLNEWVSQPYLGLTSVQNIADKLLKREEEEDDEQERNLL